MYSVGDLVFYGKTGVCRIEDVTEMRSAASGTGMEDYYILKPLHQECKISIPVNNDRVFMRPIVSEEEALAIIDSIPDMKAEAFYCHNLNQLKEHYRNLMETHDCSVMIELILSVYAKRLDAIENKKKLGAVDERFMKEAEELIDGEFSAALGIPKGEVREFIKNRIG